MINLLRLKNQFYRYNNIQHISHALYFGQKLKKPTENQWVIFRSGGRGIRTPGGVTLNSFQDCRIRPLCHSSNNGCKYMFVFLWFKKTL